MSGKYSGMTVNDRLYVSGYIDEFGHAVQNRHLDKVRKILSELELNEEAIKSILKECNFLNRSRS
jgi:hypothetical protein